MPRPYRSRLRTDLKPQAERLRSQGRTNAEIAAALRISRQTVLTWLGPQPRFFGRRPACEAAPEPKPLTWETAEWADGRAIAEWLEATGHGERLFVCGVSNDVSKWRTQGGTASVWFIDRVFTKLGLHIAQLPDDVWVAHRQAARREMERVAA